jgi:type VII secretion-associated protein (TIGR03931 family)
MTVVDVGPDTVRCDGAGPAIEPALVEAALDWIDEPVGLYLDRPVAVGELWRAVMVAAVGESCRRIVVVHPDDWPRQRVDRLLAAANTVADEVVATRRSQWSPDEVTDLADTPGEDRRRTVRSSTLALALLVATAVAVLIGATVAVLRPAPARQAASPSRTEVAAEPRMVEEGRIAVLVPADWTVARVTGGPGSRRLQVSSPEDPDVAVHITQSYAPETTLTQAAEVLARAISGQVAGVFVDLRADARFAGRPAVSYREIRSGRSVSWWVVVAGTTRISVGCQSPPDAEEPVRAACEQAVASVRERGTDPAR